jgi:hypothetical protein
MLSALLAGVAALAAGGAVTLRDREEPREVTTAPVGS